MAGCLGRASADVDGVVSLEKSAQMNLAIHASTVSAGGDKAD